jgi:hypothetical protein
VLSGVVANAGLRRGDPYIAEIHPRRLTRVMKGERMTEEVPVVAFRKIKPLMGAA